jgi:hypothetical protein
MSRAKTRRPARDPLREQEARRAARAEQRAVEAGIEETLALETARGACFARPEGGRGPAERLDGLAWLWRKGRLSATQREAGRRYGDLYRRVYLNGQYRTFLDDTPRGFSELNPAEARRDDQRRMERARRDGLSGLASLIGVVDQVCGEGARITDLEPDDRRNLRLEERLSVALELLAAHYGLT